MSVYQKQRLWGCDAIGVPGARAPTWRQVLAATALSGLGEGANSTVRACLMAGVEDATRR